MVSRTPQPSAIQMIAASIRFHARRKDPSCRPSCNAPLSALVETTKDFPVGGAGSCAFLLEGSETVTGAPREASERSARTIMDLSRRDFLKASGGAALTGTALGSLTAVGASL